MSKKTILILGIVYAVATLILYNVLHTAIGGFIMTLSLLVLVVAIVGAIYYLIKFSIKQIIHNFYHINITGKTEQLSVLLVFLSAKTSDFRFYPKGLFAYLKIFSLQK